MILSKPKKSSIKVSGCDAKYNARWVNEAKVRSLLNSL